MNPSPPTLPYPTRDGQGRENRQTGTTNERTNERTATGGFFFSFLSCCLSFFFSVSRSPRHHRDRTGLDWTGLDRTGLGWVGLDGSGARKPDVGCWVVGLAIGPGRPLLLGHGGGRGGVSISACVSSCFVCLTRSIHPSIHPSIYLSVLCWKPTLRSLTMAG